MIMEIKIDEDYPEELTISEADIEFDEMFVTEDRIQAGEHANKTGGQLYTQIQDMTTAFLRGFHVVNSTGRYLVVKR